MRLVTRCAALSLVLHCTALCAESRYSLSCVESIEFPFTLPLVTHYAALCVESVESLYALSLVNRFAVFNPGLAIRSIRSFVMTLLKFNKILERNGTKFFIRMKKQNGTGTKISFCFVRSFFVLQRERIASTSTL